MSALLHLLGHCPAVYVFWKDVISVQICTDLSPCSVVGIPDTELHTVTKVKMWFKKNQKQNKLALPFWQQKQLTKARGRKSGVWAGWSEQQIKVCPVQWLQAGGDDGHLCPARYSHQESSAGRPAQRKMHSHCHAAGQRCGRSLCLPSLGRTFSLLLCYNVSKTCQTIYSVLMSGESFWQAVHRKWLVLEFTGLSLSFSLNTSLKNKTIDQILAFETFCHFVCHMTTISKFSLRV